MQKTSSVEYRLTCSTEDGRIADWIANQLSKRLGPKAVSAKGFVVEPKGKAQILTIIKDPRTNPPYQVLALAKCFGRCFGVTIVEGELVGEVPFEVLLDCAGFALSAAKIRPGQVQLEAD